MLRKAFVISPIGQPGSKARQQADAVLEKIIEPAAKKLEAKNINLQVVRGEHDQSGKAILAEILDGILHYDIVIAVLFEPNPNVFYEVGVAESAGRPMLVLKHSDFPVPHDLKDVRYVEYTSRDLGGFRALDPMRVDGPGALLSAAMEQRVGGKRYKWPFDRELLAALGQQNILSRFRDLTPLEWSRIVLEAEQEVWLAGLTLKQLCESPAFHFPDADGAFPEEPNAYLWRLLGSAMSRGVMVHLLMMHPDNPALPHMLMRPPELQQAGASELDKVRNDLAHSKDAWLNALASASGPALTGTSAERIHGDGGGSWRLVELKRGIIPQRITLTEREVVTTPYFSTTPYNSRGPCVRARADTPWHQFFHAELRFLAELNADTSLAGGGRATG
jgi:hypothetical protein